MLLLPGVFLAGGCGGRAEQKAEVKAVASLPKPAERSGYYIPAVYLERNEFLDFGNTKYKDKLVLQLALQKDSSHSLLSVQPTGKSGEVFDKGKSKHPKPFAGELNCKKANFIFEEHHTKENEYQKLWNEVNKYALVKYVLFEPELDSGRHFRYKITGVEKLPTDRASQGFATTSYYSHPSNHSWK